MLQFGQRRMALVVEQNYSTTFFGQIKMENFVNVLVKTRAKVAFNFFYNREVKTFNIHTKPVYSVFRSL